MKGDSLELIITFFVEARFRCFLGYISYIFIMKNYYTKFQHLKLSIEQPPGQLLCYIQYPYYTCVSILLEVHTKHKCSATVPTQIICWLICLYE